MYEVNYFYSFNFFSFHFIFWRILRCEVNGNCELQDLVGRYNVEESWPKSLTLGEDHYDKSSISITRNLDKCISCGRCERVCHEMQGMDILHFVGRGVNTKLSLIFIINILLLLLLFYYYYYFIVIIIIIIIIILFLFYFLFMKNSNRRITIGGDELHFMWTMHIFLSCWCNHWKATSSWSVKSHKKQEIKRKIDCLSNGSSNKSRKKFSFKKKL